MLDLPTVGRSIRGSTEKNGRIKSMHNHKNDHVCCSAHQHGHQHGQAQGKARDPVCGMMVDPLSSKHHTVHETQA